MSTDEQDAATEDTEPQQQDGGDPGPGATDDSHGESSADQDTQSTGDGSDEVDSQDRSDPDTFVDRSKIDFDPDDGLLSGTAIHGGTSIPGPHESVDDVDPESDGEDEGGDGGSGADRNDDDDEKNTDDDTDGEDG